MSSRYIGKGSRIVEQRSTLSLDIPAIEELEEQSPIPPSHQISPLGLSDTGEYNFGHDNDTKERRQHQSRDDTDGGGSSIIGYEDPIRLNESTQVILANNTHMILFNHNFCVLHF